MSSRELLELLEGLPETSRYKEALERTYRVVRYCGDDPELKAKHGDNNLLMPAVGKPPTDVTVLAEFVDWTFDRKIAARTVRELIAARGQDDFSNLEEPLTETLASIEAQEKSDKAALVRNRLMGSAFGLRKVVS